MIEKNTAEDIVFTILNYIVLTLLTLLFLYPMLHVLFSSISNPEQLMRHSGIMLKPLGFSLKGYQIVFSNPNIIKGYVNTVFYTSVGTVLNLLLTSMGAYALSRKHYMLKKQITMGIVFTMYFSGGLIPIYLLVQNLGLYNTRAAIILPVAITTWNLIVMKTSFQAIPDSLDESAKIDGANDFTILFRIYIPVAKPTIAVMTLFYAVSHWNSWFNAMIFLQDRSLFPLQLFLREILIARAVGGNTSPDSDVFFLEEVIKNATIIISTVPILFAYPFAQKYFMTGLMLGSLKE